MTVHDDTQIFPTETQTFPRANVFRADAVGMVVIDANGGSVAIEADLGDETWIAIEGSPWSADAAFHLAVGNGRFRFTPSGGALYSFTALL